jgi:triacylglycerol esterase/lipase EstA (alpha/beta hydrolase family)
MILASLAAASPSFDPGSPAATFNGQETYTQDGATRLWAEIARYEDPDTELFGAVNFSAGTAWPEEADYAPWIDDCFGTTTPGSGSFLLHVGPSAGLATGTPILFVPGAADNGSRGFVTMAWHEDLAGRPVFAMTFGTPHGDVYQHAELVADAIAAVKARTGAEQVDVVAHSKGGVEAAIYASNFEGSAWDGAAFEASGTRYRGDVRRLVLIATPLGGLDTAYRWSASNYVSLDAQTAISPSSWSTYYPDGTAAGWSRESMEDQDLLPDGADYFQGQRQLLARQDYALPGESPWLGAYALQPDWWTTYEGGLGYVSDSEGIDAAIDAGGGVLDALRANGVDPGVALFLLAGTNPIMPSGTDDWMELVYGESWSGFSEQDADAWGTFLAGLIGEGLDTFGADEGEIAGLASGDLVLGEVSGESDGLVFTTSATDASALTARGAVVEETKTVDLSHLDLLYASPITGALLIEDAGDDPGLAWEVSFGERYTEADTIGWVERVLDDEAVAWDTGADTGDAAGASPSAWPREPSGCGCASGGGLGGWLGLWVAAMGIMRRR